MADDLARWQAALSGRPYVTIRVYPADNHFLFAGSGPSTPQESMSAQPAQVRRSTSRAACRPHIPWTPPPGGVDDEQMNRSRAGVV